MTIEQQESMVFLKALQQEMITQDPVCQASPRFWVVGDYRWEVAAEGCGERTAYFSFDLCEGRSLSLKEIAEALFEHLDEDEETHLDKTELKSLIEEMKNGEGDACELEDMVEDMLDELGMDYSKFEEEEKHFIHPNTFFLTNREAKEHIERNHYHYSSQAHSYAMTAWRSPQVEKLFEILETMDWDKLTGAMANQDQTPGGN